MPGEVKLNRILHWLVTIDPSSQHNKALAQDLSTDTQIFLESETYHAWKYGKFQWLMINEHPDSGQPINLARIVEDLKASCLGRPYDAIGWAYYYCDPQRDHDEMPHLLRWVITQLCRKLSHVPHEVQEMFQCGGELSIMQIAMAFTMIVGRFKQVHLVIYDLDRMRDRKEMMDFIVHIFNNEKLKAIKLLVVCRKETGTQQVDTMLGWQIFPAEAIYRSHFSFEHLTNWVFKNGAHLPYSTWSCLVRWPQQMKFAHPKKWSDLWIREPNDCQKATMSEQTYTAPDKSPRSAHQDHPSHQPRSIRFGIPTVN